MEIDRYKDGTREMAVVETGSEAEALTQVRAWQEQGWEVVGEMAVYSGGALLPEAAKRYVQVLERAVLQ